MTSPHYERLRRRTPRQQADWFVKQQQRHLATLSDTALMELYATAYAVPNRALMHDYLGALADEFLAPLRWFEQLLRWRATPADRPRSMLSPLPFGSGPPRSQAASTTPPDGPSHLQTALVRLLRALLFDPLVPHIDKETHGAFTLSKLHKAYEARDGFWLLLLVGEVSVRGSRLFRTYHRQSGLFGCYRGPTEPLRGAGGADCPERPIATRLLLVTHLFMAYLQHLVAAGERDPHPTQPRLLQYLVTGWALALVQLVEESLECHHMPRDGILHAGLMRLIGAMSHDGANRFRHVLRELSYMTRDLHERHHQHQKRAHWNLDNPRGSCLVCAQYSVLTLNHHLDRAHHQYAPPPPSQPGSSATQRHPIIHNCIARLERLYETRHLRETQQLFQSLST